MLMKRKNIEPGNIPGHLAAKSPVAMLGLMRSYFVIPVAFFFFITGFTSPPELPPPTPVFNWVFLPAGATNGTCVSGTDCCNDIICFGLEYTPSVTGDVTSYTTGFFTSCFGGTTPLTYNLSCQMTDNSNAIAECMGPDSILFNSSGHDGVLPVTAGVPVILHQVCFTLPIGNSVLITEDPITDLTVSIDLSGGGFADEFPTYAPFLVANPTPAWPADVTVTVPCITAATPPTPPNVYDLCSNLIPAILTTTTDMPDPLTCEGSRIYSYTYTDCSNNSHTWNYTYQVDQTLPPVEVGGPVAIASTVDCILEAVPPPNLPVIQDQCGNTIPPPVPVIGGTNAGGCGGTITYTYTYVACSGASLIWTYTYTIDCSTLSLRVFLEGPYHPAGDSLLPSLNVHHLLPGQDKLLSPSIAVQLSAPWTPFGQPYNAAPWNYNGNTGMNFGDPSAPGAPMGVMPYPPDVVDWILVTVRKNGLLPADNIWTCAGWVHTDGQVTFPEACGPLNPLPADDYYILVQHRNHLGVMSPSAADTLCGGTQLTWDFTDTNSYQPIFRFGQKEIEPGIWVMYAANGEQVNNIAGIDSQDRTRWRILQNVIGYSLGDYNMNITTSSEDETVWKFNQNKTSGIIFY